MSNWTTAEAIELCRKVEPIVVPFECHVALTGGLLYKDGKRKDCDLIIYRRGTNGDEVLPELDRDAFMRALAGIDLLADRAFSRVIKCFYHGAPVDLIFTEAVGEYIEGSDAKDQVAAALLG